MTRPEDVTDAMVTGAHLALYEASAHELDATDDELRAAIAAAINASGCVLVPREPTESILDAMYPPLEMDDSGLRRLWAEILAASDPRQQAQEDENDRF